MSFFATPWTTLAPNFTSADQTWLLNEAGYSLGALGRLTEAVEPMRAGLEWPLSKTTGRGREHGQQLKRSGTHAR
ncbi:MAG: hypothetical protein JF614_29785 [Acidobacteria bacterium]|nr:hypothetical protein [Acidobacteriota bacterium]